MCNRKTVLGLLFLACVILSGCTYRYGRLQPNSQFPYANSNVTPLGHVHAEVKTSSWFVYPKLGVDDIKGTYNDALRQQAGANILINFKEDTYTTSFAIIPYYQIRYVIDGEAARMDVGRQELK